MSEPKRHHYLPKFYLKQWCGPDKKLWEYSRPYREVIADSKYPVETGFQEYLYTQKGCAREDEQAIEIEFMQIIDNEAAQALNQLEQGNISEKTKSAWSAFLLSLDMRNPKSVRILKESIGEIWKEKISNFQDNVLIEHGQEKYEYTKMIFENDPNLSDRHALSLLTKLIEHSDIRQIIHGMVWLVRSVNKPSQFITSDSPIVMTISLSEENAYLILPIGPQKLFIATKDIETAKIFEALPDEHLATQVNRIVAGRAHQYVYASDDSMLSFVKEHMGKRQSPNLIERVSRMNVKKSEYF